MEEHGGVMVDTTFTVYGQTLDEIEERARVIARKFFGDREPFLRFEVTKVGAMSSGGDGKLNLWQAEVHASWSEHTIEGLPAPW